MAKNKEQPSKVVETIDKVDVVQLVKDSKLAHGSTSFMRIDIGRLLISKELQDLSSHFSKDGYEVFTNELSVLLLKQ